MLPTFNQLQEFLEEEYRLLDNIPQDVRKSSGNASRRVTPDQRMDGSGCRIETSPPLRRESNSQPLPVYAAEWDQRWTICEAIGHELTTCRRMRSCKFCDRLSHHFFLRFKAPSARRPDHTAGPPRQLCAPEHPTSGTSSNTRTRSISHRTGMSGSWWAGSISPDQNCERYANTYQRFTSNGYQPCTSTNTTKGDLQMQGRAEMRKKRHIDSLTGTSEILRASAGEGNKTENTGWYGINSVLYRQTLRRNKHNKNNTTVPLDDCGLERLMT
ncbi:hypothetical protein EVAR_94834_1 [Eumeta japonica]|uniref:Uncharacterized protein n=1 Tax=Eumeta variegata TaxID=151549 RepID=A0A4C1UIV8_EUMVA|nr:hypothetical protein EVAR_94834_1 [Eumeta japonica]